MASSPAFDRELHAHYFLSHLRALPAAYASQDSQRVVVAFFCVHGLALLGKLADVDRRRVIEWVYSLQVPTTGGFRGGTYLGPVVGGFASDVSDSGNNIASTFAALCILRTLGDDLSRVDKRAIVRSLASLQNPNTGSFSSVAEGSEQDMRFVYCACAIAYILDDWSGIDLLAMKRFIHSCLSYDGGIGLDVGAESHGGAAFTAIASLALCGQLPQLEGDVRSALVRWLVFRQQQRSGFQGRINKRPDSCYAFWNGATLALLDQHALVDVASCQRFIYSCQCPRSGGLCKYPATQPDVMHSYLSLAWLSIAAHASADTDAPESPRLAALDTKLQVPFFPALPRK